MVKRVIILIMAFLQFGLDSAIAMTASQEYQAANKMFASGNYRNALPLYQKLLSSPPHGVPVSDIHSRIGDGYFRLGFFQDALDAYRSAIKDQKQSARPETQYWIGFCCFLLGRDDEAVTEFLKIPAFYPGSGMWIGTAYYWAGRASERMGKADQAAAYYRKAGGNGKSTQGKFAHKKAEEMKRQNTAESGAR